MQLLTSAPRDSLTADQVRFLLLETPNTTYVKGLELLDANLTVLDDLSDDLQGGQIIRTMNADVHGTCSLQIATDINYLTQLVRPYMTLEADGLSARFYLGAYVLRKPSTVYGASIPSNSVDGSDRLWLLNRPADPWVAYGTDTVLQSVLLALAAAGVSGVLIDGSAQDIPMPADRVWPMFGTMSDGTDANGTTTWLQIVNALLQMIGYRGLWCDWMGLYRSEPYLDPASRASEFTFDYDDALRVTITPDRTVERDLSSLPNRWVFVQQNAITADGVSITPAEGAGLYIVDHSQDPSAPGYRNGARWSTAPVQIATADQPSLVTLGDAAVAADERVAQTLTVTTAPFPAAWHWDLYSYSDSELGGLMRVEETAWTLDLGQNGAPPADMQRTWSVVAS